MTTHGTRFRSLLAVPAALLMIVTACEDNAPLPTSPNPPGSLRSQVTGESVQSTDPLSNRLSTTPGACLVAVRGTDGRYLSRAVTVELPKAIASSSATIARFAYRGWAPAVPEPVLLAVCSIPDAGSARAYFEKRFGGKYMKPTQLLAFAQTVGVAGVENWAGGASPHLVQGTVAYITDGLASESEATKSARPGGVTAMMVACDDPTAIIPPEDCGGYSGEDEYVPVNAPAEDYRFPFGAMPLPLPVPVIVCTGLTEDPHLSTTPGFEGRINVKARTTCPFDLTISVRTALFRERCTWFICLPQQIGPTDTQTTFGTFVEAKSNALCVWPSGWYKAYSAHSVTNYYGTTGGQTQSPWTGIRCA